MVDTTGEISQIDAELIFPASEKQIKKHSKKETFLLRETAEFYYQVF